ncbi:MAG: DUF2953 domain-containing protein, partial [Methanobrevibacter sp.]|nr:DUF2953 domain-containing protein [Methanobrevibacter sp.]
MPERCHKCNKHQQIGKSSCNRLSNFAKTGEYIGYVWAISSILTGILPNSRLSAEPSFNGEVLNFKGQMNIDIY